MINSLIRMTSGWWHRIRESRRREFIERLCANGMELGKNVVIMQDVVFDVDYPWLIEIGDGARVSSNTRIMAHDATVFRDLGVTRIGRVRILAESFIGENCIILPGVTIGPRAMVAAGSVVSRDIGEGMLAAGNPARVYGRYDEMLERIRAAATDGFIVPVADITNPAQIEKVRAALDRGEQVFVRDAEDDELSNYHNIARDDVHRSARDAFVRNFGKPSSDDA